MSADFIKPEDYTEPTCPFCDPTDRSPRQIPVGRVLSRLDEYIAARDTRGALRHLNYWIADAKDGGDEGGLLTLLNEKMGVLRNAGQTEEAIGAANETLGLLKKMGEEELSAKGTAYLNIGTVMSAAGKNGDAHAYYEKAKEIYARTLGKGDRLYAGLYNNDAIVLARLGRYEEARASYEGALSILEAIPDGELDRAVTYTNLADLMEAQYGLEEGEEAISAYLRRARELLDSPNYMRGHYAAFVYEKCAPTFSYYGWFVYAEELKERSKSIYEGT